MTTWTLPKKVLYVTFNIVTFPIQWVWGMLTYDQREPTYLYGPRGGRYTYGDSWDGGTYKRYR